MLLCLGISCQHPCSARKEAVLVGTGVGTKASEHGLLGLPSHPESSRGEKSPWKELKGRGHSRGRQASAWGPGSHWVSLLLLPSLKIDVGSKVSQGVPWGPCPQASSRVGRHGSRDDLGCVLFWTCWLTEGVTCCTFVVWHGQWLSSHHVSNACLIDRSVVRLGSALALPDHSLQTLASSDTLSRGWWECPQTPVCGYFGDGGPCPDFSLIIWYIFTFQPSNLISGLYKIEK